VEHQLGVGTLIAAAFRIPPMRFGAKKPKEVRASSVARAGSRPGSGVLFPSALGVTDTSSDSVSGAEPTFLMVNTWSMTWPANKSPKS
jgi:hypothetical protein